MKTNIEKFTALFLTASLLFLISCFDTTRDNIFDPKSENFDPYATSNNPNNYSNNSDNSVNNNNTFDMYFSDRNNWDSFDNNMNIGISVGNKDMVNNVEWEIYTYADQGNRLTYGNAQDEGDEYRIYWDNTSFEVDVYMIRAKAFNQESEQVAFCEVILVKDSSDYVNFENISDGDTVNRYSHAIVSHPK